MPFPARFAARPAVLAFGLILAQAQPVFAQETSVAEPEPAAAPPIQAPAPEAPPTDVPPTDAPVVNEDEMADDLNSRQQLQQRVIFTRTINGEVVQTEEKTIVYDRTDPVRDTEASRSALEALRLEFDREVLTRKEAYEEAKLDFVVADLDRDERMTADEFIRLVAAWRDNEAREATGAASAALGRRERVSAFLDSLEPEAADAQARAKFTFLAGVSGELSRRDYIREYLADFDAHDADNDGLLTGDELLRFRAASRGADLGL